MIGITDAFTRRPPVTPAVLLLILTGASLWAREAVRRRPEPAVDGCTSFRIESRLRTIPTDGPRLPAEFEPQKAILLAGSPLLADHPHLFTDLVSAMRGEVALYVLINDEEERELGENVLRARGIPPRTVTFLRVPHDSPWVRDYGPQATEDVWGRTVLVDSRYGSPERFADENAPVGLAALLKLPLERTAILLEGGNLLSNGRGTFLTTTLLLELNREWGLSEDELREELHRVYGARDVIFLDPVLGEPTGHVDTFVTWVAPDTVVLASCDPDKDPLNAERLDRTAALLAGLRVDHRPLRVLRVPTPHAEDGIWRTYTNVLYANGAVLVPVYRHLDAAGRRRTLDVFRSCFPDRRVIAIDVTDIAELEGALHCLSMNLGPASLPLPAEIGRREAR